MLLSLGISTYLSQCHRTSIRKHLTLLSMSHLILELFLHFFWVHRKLAKCHILSTRFKILRNSKYCLLSFVLNLLCPKRELPVVGTDPGIGWHSEAGAGLGLRSSGAILGSAGAGARAGGEGALWPLTARRDRDQAGAWVRGRYSAARIIS